MSATAPRQLEHKERLAWLRLIRSEKVGPASFHQLLSRYGSAGSALEALPDLARRGGASARLRITSLAEAEREMEAAERLGARFVALGEADYPPLLKEIDHPPPLVCVKGSPALLGRAQIAVVGARNGSLAGIKIAKLLAGQLGAAGYGITSGLARGIDTAAHLGSLESGTVAVLAGGLDKPYPPENIKLAAEIVERGGSLISEMPLGWSPRAIDFPRRNRLIAGLSHGLVVVEAAQRSGSLISARLAGEQGRLVFAVPGSPLDARNTGSNALLKDGAILVTEADDVLQALAPSLSNPYSTRANLPASGASEDGPSSEASDGALEKVLECLSPVPATVDEIIRHTQLAAADVQFALLELDLGGRLERHSGGAVSLVDVSR
ncbi:DNA-processing protein DprA [Tianweitania sediminis]|uniref:DNA-processing protein DprA n=1 Tax=Tianweitania sediminis TaxID=1502156 RepID=A0A8J7R339_9HYPH|nr:DNA-processing protein DprA [Tianweitania sediminis]